MIVGARIKARLEALGMTQSELARHVGITQGAIGALICGRARSSVHLPKITKHLQTTIAYIEGETDNPDANAPAPEAIRSYQAVTVQVLLPGERALAWMFEGLLRSMDLSAPVDAQALLLAQRLPFWLSQLRELVPDTVQTSQSLADQPADLPKPVFKPGHDRVHQTEAGTDRE